MLSRSSRGRLKKDIGVRAVAWTAGMTMGPDAESSALSKAGVGMIMVLGCYKLWRIQMVGTIATLSDDNAEKQFDRGSSRFGAD